MKWITIALFLAFHPLYAEEIDLNSLPAPYNTAHLMPFRLDGWFDGQNEGMLNHIIPARRVKIVIEVGSWMGLSTHCLAKLIQDDGKVYAVDTFEGTPGEFHPKETLDTLYDQFLSNVIHAKLTHKIVPIKMESTLAAQSLEIPQADLVYLDATHEYNDVLADLRAWYPYVKGHGTLCGDDWAWG